MVRRCAPYHARTLGVPVAFSNRTGPIDTELPGGFGDSHSSFPGYSQIVDSDGGVKAEEGVIVADVLLSAERKLSKKLRRYGAMWAFPMPWFAYIWPEHQRMGEKDHAENPRRRQAALAAAMMICNLPGHYEQGMRVDFNVTGVSNEPASTPESPATEPTATPGS